MTNAIASSLQTDGLGAAIASGSNLDSESSASNVSDDSSSSDNSLVIIAAAVGGLVVVVVLFVVIYLARSSKQRSFDFKDSQTAMRTTKSWSGGNQNDFQNSGFPTDDL